MIKIYELTSSDPKVIDAINNLLHQLSQSASDTTAEFLEEGLKQKNFFIFLAEDDKINEIIGMGIIFFVWRPEGWMGQIHSLVVDQKRRGHGIGRLLIKVLLKTARDFAQKTGDGIIISLTSKPIRVEANNLYQKLGFELVSQASEPNGTNLYKILIKP